MEYLLILNIIIIIGVAFFVVWAYKLLKAVYHHNAKQTADHTAAHTCSYTEEKVADVPADGKGEEQYAEPEYSDDGEEEHQDEWWKGMTPTELFKRSMAELGCKCVRNEDKSYEYYVKYQGETFIVHVGDDLIFIRIYDTLWYKVSMEDIDTFSEARRLVNDINLDNIATIVYSVDKENNVAYLSTYMKGLFSDFIPLPDKYLARLFDDMLSVQRIFLTKMARFKGEEA